MKLSDLVKLPEMKEISSKTLYSQEQIYNLGFINGHNKCLSEFEAMDVEIYEEKLIEILSKGLDEDIGCKYIAKSIIAALPELIKQKGE